jgi:ubiquinone/menaquinone biosynthesis C-methylase UbiE
MTRQMQQPKHRYYSVMRYLAQHPGLRVVELGFGDPVMAAAIAQFCGEYTIIDIVDRREGFVMPENVTFVQTNLDEDFALPDGEFDCVIAMMVIEHLYDPFHAFAEVLRITKPGGKIFINLPNIGSLRCRLQILRGELPLTSSPEWRERRAWDGNHLHYFTVKETRWLANLTGMSFEEIFPVGEQLSLKRMRPSLFCHEISYVFSRPDSA